MTTRRTGWIVGGLAVALVLSTLAPVIGGAVLVLAVPVAVAGSGSTRRRPTGHQDVAERLVAAATTLTGERTSPDGEQVGWGAALRAELASIMVPRERRRFASAPPPRCSAGHIGSGRSLSRQLWRSRSVRACWACRAPGWATTDSGR